MQEHIRHLFSENIQTMIAAGDSLAAPRRLAEGVQLDYLTLEYLAELTMSISLR